MSAGFDLWASSVDQFQRGKEAARQVARMQADPDLIGALGSIPDPYDSEGLLRMLEMAANKGDRGVSRIFPGIEEGIPGQRFKAWWDELPATPESVHAATEEQKRTFALGGALALILLVGGVRLVFLRQGEGTHCCFAHEDQVPLFSRLRERQFGWIVGTGPNQVVQIVIDFGRRIETRWRINRIGMDGQASGLNILCVDNAQSYGNGKRLEVAANRLLVGDCPVAMGHRNPVLPAPAHEQALADYAFSDVFSVSRPPDVRARPH